MLISIFLILQMFFNPGDNVSSRTVIPKSAAAESTEESQRTYGSEVRKQVDSYFKNALKDFDSFEVEMISSSENIKNIRFLSDQFEKDKSIISLLVEAELVNGEKMKTFLSFRLKLFKKAYFADASIERNEELKPENLVLKTLEVNSTNGHPVYSQEAFFNTVAKKRIMPGDVLLLEMIEKAPVITAGSKVTANVVSGSTVISFDAVSRQDGREDEIIRIVTQDKKLFKAKVIDSVNVEIME